MRHVVVMGGGVGGLSAAHELAERGFDVEVYEAEAGYGGKARSVFAPGCVRGGAPLPGEHGHRIFLGFYHHLLDTMGRIPFGDNPDGVRGNLVPTDTTLFFPGAGRAPMEMATSFTRKRDLVRVLATLRSLAVDSAVRPAELGSLFALLARVLCACEARRFQELDSRTWSEFVGAEARSEAFRTAFVRGWTQTFAALTPEHASTRTMGEVLSRMWLTMIQGDRTALRVLDGPTSLRWIDPWVEHLRRLGVRFHANHPLRRIHLGRDGRVHAVQAGDTVVRADAYVLALPVERLRPLVHRELRAAAPSLGGLDRLKVEFMGGIQLYLARDLPMTRGHCHYADSPWALTSISQARFWRSTDLRDWGPGDIRGVVSVSIGDWYRPGEHTTRLPAIQCSPRQLAAEVWAQIVHHLPPASRRAFEAAELLDFLVDPRIADPATRESRLEPLMLNTTNSWADRPDAATEVPNLVLAADFVRTGMDLATMEAANEAARRAVNALLAQAGKSVDPCFVRPFVSPAPFSWLQTVDERVYRRSA